MAVVAEWIKMKSATKEDIARGSPGIRDSAEWLLIERHYFSLVAASTMRKKASFKIRSALQ
jgi:hypothetical protein